MIQSLNLVFCGTPAFAVPTLEKLVDAGFRVHLVVTQPDRPKGRGLELVSSRSKQSRLQLNLPIAQPESIKNNDEFRAQLAPSNPTPSSSSATAASFRNGCSIFRPSATSTCTPRCCRNIAAPRQSSGRLRDGETVTGNTTMRIDAGLDTGDILLQQEIPIASRRYGRDAGSKPCVRWAPN